MIDYLIAANWKMNTNIAEAAELATCINDEYIGKNGVEVLVCPPFTNIYQVEMTLKDSTIKIGAQNCYYEDKGAYTGEISVEMIKSIGCEYIIVGHSERRAIFADTDIIVNKKAQAVLKANMKPIICIGETLDERKSGETNLILETQLRDSLIGISDSKAKDIVVAYEPVWAIGTGVSAELPQIKEAHYFIRGFLKERFGDDGESIQILYGGSVKPSNAKDVLSIDNVNGALIGGASLKADLFLPIISVAQALI